MLPVASANLREKVEKRSRGHITAEHYVSLSHLDL